MKVNDLIERLQGISDQGYGDSEAQAWDPDSEEWESVTGMTYAGGTGQVRIYTDEP